MVRTIWPTLAFVLFLRSAAAVDAAENRLLDELTRQGARLSSSDQPTKLPPPLLDGSLDAAAQGKEVRRIAGKKYPYEQFVRNSPVAPFLLEIHSLGGGQRKGGGKADQRGDAKGRVQQVDLWFVAHGALETVTDRDLMGQLAGDAGKSGDDTRSQELTEKELRARDLSIEAGDDRRTNFFHFDLPVLERVRLSGLGQSETTRDSQLVIAAVRLDPRFTDDADYPARWRPIKRDAAGNKVVGEPQPYSGFAGYCQATELAEPKGALFVECHVVFDEPHGWFNGTNLLRAKLPLLVQDNVRTFRRKLAAAERAER